MYWTYILISSNGDKTYTGHTNKLENRLFQHNSGKDNFTRRYKPWKILHKEIFETESDSIKREKYFKSAAGRRWIRKNLFE